MFEFALIKINQDMPDPVKVKKCQPCALPYSIGWGLYQNYTLVHLDEDDKLKIVMKLPLRGNEHVNRSKD